MTQPDIPQGPSSRPKGRTNPRPDYRSYSPTRVADKTSSGVGLLEAEFFGVIFLLLIQLFIGGSATYGDKMMSFMKRGLLSAILFFFLALVAGIGPNAAKVSKGIGALVFVATLVSSPGQDIISSLDGFFKADWTGTSESANDQTASADSGTSGGTSGTISKAENAASKAASTITEIDLPGIGNVIAASSVINELKKLFHL